MRVNMLGLEEWTVSLKLSSSAFQRPFDQDVESSDIESTQNGIVRYFHVFH